MPSPAPSPGTLPRRVVGVWAHPDDEAYLSGGLMARVVDAGGHVTVVTMTDGEHGFAPDDPRSVGDRRALRRREVREAMVTIGVHDIRFLGLPDGGVGPVATSRLAALVAPVLEEIQPDTVVTFGPDGMTGHTDHVACGLATTMAWAQCGTGRLLHAAKSTEWLDQWRPLHDELGIWMTEEPQGLAVECLDVVVELRGAELQRKRAVLRCHASQTTAVAASLGEATYLRWIDQESFRSPEHDEFAAASAAEAPRAFSRTGSPAARLTAISPWPTPR